MKIKINYNTLLPLLLTGTLSLTGGCSGKTSLEKALNCKGYNSAYRTEYFDITKNGESIYFAPKSDYVDALSKGENQWLYDLGLKVDDNGNTIVIDPFHIKENEVDCILTNCRLGDSGKVLIGTPSDKRWGLDGYHVEKVDGYRISTDDGTYDIKTADLMDAYYNKDFWENCLEFTSNNNGGPDTVVYTYSNKRRK